MRAHLRDVVEIRRRSDLEPQAHCNHRRARVTEKKQTTKNTSEHEEADSANEARQERVEWELADLQRKIDQDAHKIAKNTPAERRAAAWQR